MSKIKLLAVHHSASPRATTFEQIREWHLARGWRDIGYHRGIRQASDGHQVQVQDLRPHDGDADLDTWEYGAHVKGSNAHSLGVVLVGNYSTEPVPPAMWSALIECLAGWCYVYGLDPYDAVSGHNEAATNPTECPGRQVDMVLLRFQVYKRLDAIHAHR